MNVDPDDPGRVPLERAPDPFAGRSDCDRVPTRHKRGLERVELRWIAPDEDQAAPLHQGRSAQQRNPIDGRALPAARLPPALQAASSSALV